MIGKTYYIVFVRYFDGGLSKQWELVKICKTREEADEVLDRANNVDEDLNRWAEYTTRVIKV